MEAQKRIEELVAKRVEEELEKRREEIEAEVLRRVEEAKKVMEEQKYAFLTSDPENLNGHGLIRSKFGLAPPNQFKYGRSQGGISNIELEKLGIGMRCN